MAYDGRSFPMMRGEEFFIVILGAGIALLGMRVLIMISVVIYRAFLATAL